MKKFIPITVLIFAILSTAIAAAPNVQTGAFMTTKNVNVRLLPKVGSTRIDHLLKGQTVTVKRKVKGWCEIDHKKFQHAYVDCSLLQKAISPTINKTPPLTTHQNYNGAAVTRNENGNWVLGSKSAPIVMEEFGDLQCPYCGSFFTNSFPKIFNNYIATGKVKYVFYNFPLEFHTQAQTAAKATLCAGDQDKYWQMHAFLLNHQDEWSSLQGDSPEAFEGFAQKDIGLKATVFNTCLLGNTHDAQIAQDIAEGSKRNVSGTPTFYINGKRIDGARPYQTFADAIENALPQSKNQKIIKELKPFAAEILLELKNKDFKKLSTHIHPTKGLRFQPYFSETEGSTVFTAKDFLEASSSPKKYNWGYYDGSGLDIYMSFNDYYKNFIYNRDFITLEPGFSSTADPALTTSMAGVVPINFNLAKKYPNGIGAIYYSPEKNPINENDQYQQWENLILVFEKQNNQWYLAAIIRDTWEI